MTDEYQKLKEAKYAALEKNFVTYANLTTVTVLDITTDLEPFVTLPSFGKGLIGKYVVRYDIENLQNQNIILRKGVYEKLQNVDGALKRKKDYENCQLVVVYGYRSFDMQQQLFNTAREKFIEKNPGFDESEITEAIHREVAVPAVAGYPTGGAVDVTIYDYENGRFLDFGTDARDFSTKDAYYDSPYISDLQRNNRVFLRKIMTAEDFAPYNGEWWHFSYGDKEWAFYKYQRSNYKRRGTVAPKPDIRELKYLYAQKSPTELIYADKFRTSASVERADMVRLAVQKKGRLTDDTIDILNKSGMDVAYDEGKFFGKCNNFPLEILFVRDDDIPNLVDAGAADIGIVGENVYNEYDCKSEILKKMGFGRCALAIAVPENSSITSIFDLSNKRVATSYRRSVEKFFKDEGINVDIVDVSGSVEMSPTIGYADAIADLVSTGSSLRQNNLKFLHKIFDSESILIANRPALENSHKRATVDHLLSRISGYLNAKKYKHIMFSIPNTQIENVIPVLSNAKLLSKSAALDNGDISVVRAVIHKSSVWDVIGQLEELGAVDIVLYNIENIMSN